MDDFPPAQPRVPSRRRALLRFAGWMLGFVVLTLLTQIGGLALLLSGLLVGRVRRRFGPSGRHWLPPAVFLAVYVTATFALAPPLAQIGGRYPLPCLAEDGGSLAALTPLTCLLNRNYAGAHAGTVLDALAAHMHARFPGTQVRYLDAGFPFGLGFPLLPHLSHGDGRKVDLAFFYSDPAGYAPGLSPSPIGYWAFEAPRPGDPQPCAGFDSLLSLRWDMGWLQPLWPDAVALEPDRTGAMLRWLAGPGADLGVRKVLLEPHLAARLGVTGSLVRFRAAGPRATTTTSMWTSRADAARRNTILRPRQQTRIRRAV